ncbi:AMP-binding protein, partial [Celeribacter marinus]|uniref:AMP-binding protein n=1 Tax=Celeribacter marinus TaxID=1397108 RepID=UPI003F6D8ED3
MTKPSPAFTASAHIDRAGYDEMYARSVSDPVGFWGEMGKTLDWITPYTQVKNTTFDFGRVDIQWYSDGVLNVSANCIDRHLPKRSLQTAIIFEPDDPETPAQHITYKELSDKVNRFANVLLSQGVMRGDRVVIYLPMIPEAAYAMLACARIGAIHSIVFAGFSPDALANRINDSGAKVVITADHAPRGGRSTPLKSNTDAALLHCSDKVRCLVVKHTGEQTSWVQGRDVDVKYLMEHASPDCPPRPMNAEDPL